MLENAKWISGSDIKGCPEFLREFSAAKPVASAKLTITALGVYAAYLNGRRVGNFHLAPGWTVYRKRVQVQEYDITDLLEAGNRLSVTLGSGWYSGTIAREAVKPDTHPALIAELNIVYTDGSCEVIVTD